MAQSVNNDARSDWWI